jgi:hypothetical protein
MRECAVIAGLDPAIHPFRNNYLQSETDPRVKPAGDAGDQNVSPVRNTSIA